VDSPVEVSAEEGEARSNHQNWLKKKMAIFSPKMAITFYCCWFSESLRGIRALRRIAWWLRPRSLRRRQRARSCCRGVAGS
jgi:hypothetical protein